MTNDECQMPNAKCQMANAKWRMMNARLAPGLLERKGLPVLSHRPLECQPPFFSRTRKIMSNCLSIGRRRGNLHRRTEAKVHYLVFLTRKRHVARGRPLGRHWPFGIYHSSIYHLRAKPACLTRPAAWAPRPGPPRPASSRPSACRGSGGPSRPSGPWSGGPWPRRGSSW